MYVDAGWLRSISLPIYHMLFFVLLFLSCRAYRMHVIVTTRYLLYFCVSPLFVHQNTFFVFVFPAKNEVLFYQQYVETSGERAVGGCCFCVSALSCLLHTYIKMPQSTADVLCVVCSLFNNVVRYFSPYFCFFVCFQPEACFHHFVVFATENRSTFSFLF